MKDVKIEKKDWVELRKLAEMNYKQAMISQQQFQHLWELSIKRISEFPDEIEEKEIKDDLNSLLEDENTQENKL